MRILTRKSRSSVLARFRIISFWFLPSVASCHAVRNLLAKKQNRFYHDYQVVVAAGSAAGIGVAALPPVQEAMDDQESRQHLAEQGTDHQGGMLRL